MPARILICFPSGDSPGLRVEAAQLALGLAARGGEVIAFGPLGPWRHPLRLARATAVELALPADERKLARVVQEYEPQIIHAFGCDAAHAMLPLALLAGAGGVATLGHEDLTRLSPTQLRAAATLFVPCEYLREQVARRVPSAPVITTGHLLPPPESVPLARRRFLAQELGLDEGAQVVLMADHFRGGETEVALALIAAVPVMAERIPGLRVVIAGRGLRLGELEERAVSVNERAGYRAVLLPGHRDDIDLLLALATVAVGSGRFAMEAVGAGVPLVAAGAAGMIGAFTERTAPVAAFTCCGRHGHLDSATPAALASEIVGLFHYSDYRARFAIEGQALVLPRYERAARAAHINSSYTRTASIGAITRPPHRVAALLPDDLRKLMFSLPALAGLRAQYPLARVQAVAAERHCRLLRHLGAAEHVVAKPDRFRAWPTFLRALCRPRADLCVSFADDTASSVMAALSLAPHRVGFAHSGGSIFFTDHLQSPAQTSPARALMLTTAVGVSEAGPIVPQGVPPEAHAAVDGLLAGAGAIPDQAFILLCAQADEGLAWDEQQWLALALHLAERRPERLIMLGGEAPGLPAGAVRLPAPANSLELAALLTRAELVIAADCGELHLADALGVPTVGLYGPTSPESCSLPSGNRHPVCHRELPCHPCDGAPCPARHCLRLITPHEVAGVVSSILRPAQVDVEQTVVD